MADTEKANIVKVVLLGDSGVGKTSFINRYTNNTFENYDATLGSAFVKKTIRHNETKIEFRIWDTAGQEKYRSLAQLYYRDSDAAIIVYDITNAGSFESLKMWVKELQEKAPRDLFLVIVGNKVDLRDQEQVSTEEARAYAEDIGAFFTLASAKIDRGIGDVFSAISDKMIQTKPDFTKRGQSLKETKPTKVAKCC